MLDFDDPTARRILYAAGPVGFLFEVASTRSYKPDPFGIVAWQAANAGAMYAGTWWLTGEGSTVWSTYSPVVKEALYKGDTSLVRSLRGPKKPPLGVFATLAIGVDALSTLEGLMYPHPEITHQA